MVLRASRGCRHGVRLCYGDVYATWGQIVFCVVFLAALLGMTIDLLTTCYLLSFTEKLLAWMDGKDMATLVAIFIVVGSILIVVLLPQTVLFVGAGYLCANRIDSSFLAFSAGLMLSMVTFVIGATAAFLLSRSVLPPTCTRKFFKHFAILDGLDHALLHRGRRINVLLRVNPLTPYNALNYGLGLSSCSLRNYLEGMVGAIPFTCVAVYAGMVISNIEELDTMFSHTSALWYSIYAVFGILCLISCIALVRYTAAEMKAVLANAPVRGRDGGGIAEAGGIANEGAGYRTDDEDAFGQLEEDQGATLFGTFVSREANAAGISGDVGEEMTTLGGEDEGISRVPLLAGAGRRVGSGAGMEMRKEGGGKTIGSLGGSLWGNGTVPSVVDV